MDNKDFDLLAKYLKTHEAYKVSSKQLDTLAKFENWNDVTLQDIDKMKDIIEDFDLNKKDSIDLDSIRRNIKENNEEQKETIEKTEDEMINEGIDIKKIGWHRRLHNQEEYGKRQIENEMDLE